MQVIFWCHKIRNGESGRNSEQHFSMGFRGAYHLGCIIAFPKISQLFRTYQISRECPLASVQCYTVRFPSSDLPLPQEKGDILLVSLDLSWPASGEGLVHSFRRQLWESVVVSAVEYVEERVPEYHIESSNSYVTHMGSMAEAKKYSDKTLETALH